jgi:hypothetical protein
MLKYRFSVTLILALLLASAVPALAQGQDVGGQVEGFLTDLEGILTAVATSCAVIGFIGLAIMNLGSSLPIIADWKQENPKAARQVIMGLIILIFVGGGGLTAMLSFN